jgi:hypothetical protein
MFNLPWVNNMLGMFDADISKEARVITRRFGKIGTVFRVKATDSSNIKTSLTMDKSC